MDIKELGLSDFSNWEILQRHREIESCFESEPEEEEIELNETHEEVEHEENIEI